MDQPRPLFSLLSFFSTSGIILGSHGPELAVLSTRPPPWPAIIIFHSQLIKVLSEPLVTYIHWAFAFVISDQPHRALPGHHLVPAEPALHRLAPQRRAVLGNHLRE